MIHIIKKCNNENTYSGYGWDLEKTTKFVLDLNGKMVEAGHFLHYLTEGDEKRFIKEVIELPSSRGCPIKCSFCASSFINDCCPLTSEEIVELYEFILSERIKNNPYRLVTMTGIGDYSLCYESINTALQEINKKTPNVYFTISSCIWNNDALEAVLRLSNSVNIRSVNITYLTKDNSLLARMIPFYYNHHLNIHDIVGFFERNSMDNIRVNYLMIKDVNDKKEDFNTFIDTFESLKKKLRVRISKMNTTRASIKAGLYTPCIEDMTCFKEELISQGFDAYLFYSNQNDQMNCGQLLTEEWQ